MHPTPRTTSFPFLLLALGIGLVPATGLPAQGKQDAALKKELRTKETAAKQDPDKLCDVAAWAVEKGLAADGKRLYEAVVKLSPDHARAHAALGHVQVDGAWVPKAEAEAAQGKALAAAMQAKGLVEVDGVWVKKEHVEDGKRGVFHHDGERVHRDDYLQLQGGKVRHPATGELIAAADLAQAKAGKFPLDSGQWGDEAAADAFHAKGRPWVVRASFATVVSHLPLAKVRELAAQIDSAWVRIAPLFGTTEPLPTHRPLVVVAASEAEYAQLGQQAGDEASSTSAFLALPNARLSLPGFADVRPGICDGTGALGVYSARHAAGLAIAHSIGRDLGLDLPPWLLHGVGSLTSRLHVPGDAGHYARQDLEAGGVTDPKAMCRSFSLAGAPAARRHAQFQVGLMLDFALQGRDDAAKAATNAFADACKHGDKAAAQKALAALEEALAAAQAKLVAYQQELARN